MTRLLLLPTLLLASVGVASAAPPHKVLVLPIDGAAAPATRAALDATVRDLAKSIHGEVTAGQTSFADTAAAVGCDPATPKCTDDVIATLAVDELVWGTASPSPYGRTTLVVSRAHAHAPAERETVTVEANEPPARTRAALAPMFGVTPVAGPDEPAGAGPIAAGTTSPASDDPNRIVWWSMAGGGGLLVVIGLILWGAESGVQGDIDGHPTATVSDFQDLQRLEDRASRLAIAGDLLVLGGVAIAGFGGYEIYKHHEQTVTVAPAANPATGTVGLVIGGRW